MVVKKGALRSALKSLVRIIDPNTSLQRLQEVQLVSDGNTLKLSCDNVSASFSTEISCDGSFQGRVRALDLFRFVTPCPSAERGHLVELREIDGRRVAVATEGALVELPMSKASGAGELESTAEQHIATWRGEEFAEGVRWVLRAVGRDPSRPQLRYVKFEGHEVAATDGHRLHVANLEADLETELLLDGDALSIFTGVVGREDEVTALKLGSQILLRAGSWRLEMDAVDASFPPYRQVIPAEGSEVFSITAHREELQRAVSRLVSRHQRGGIRLVVNGALTLERSTEHGATSVTPSIVSTTHQGPNSIIGIDPSYLADAIASGADEISLRFSDGLSPVRCDLGHGRIGVVMPMRI